MKLDSVLKKFETKIRYSEIDGLSIGGESSLPFMFVEDETQTSPLIAIEVLMRLPNSYPISLKESWGDVVSDMEKWALVAEKTECDIVALRFNIDENEPLEKELDEAVSLFNNIQKKVKKPLMVLGSQNQNLRKSLFPLLAKNALKPCIFGVVEEADYKEVVPALVENNHFIIARTPIDINLAKELNILISDMGASPDKILIDPNMGGLGYGLDYGYSIMERVKLAGLEGDKMLNMQIVAFTGEEAWKAKEAKSADFPNNWGELTDRAFAWESITASSILSAGANLVVCYHKDVVKNLKRFISE